jgi:hypothetical protein
VPSDKVPSVYKAAKKLRMQAAADACSRHLINSLSPTNCIGMTSRAFDRWSFAFHLFSADSGGFGIVLIVSDFVYAGIRSFASSCSELTMQTDLYIQNNIELIMETSREFFSLKKLRFNILGTYLFE